MRRFPVARTRSSREPINPTPAEQLRSVPPSAVWAATFAVVAVLGGFATPWETLQVLLKNRGAGEEGASLLAFVAGYTLPLTAGFGVLAFGILIGAYRGASPPAIGFTIGGVLFVAGLVSGYLGLGLLPDYTDVRPSGPPYAAVPLMVLTAYLNSYGWSLMLCALAIGTAAAFQAERWCGLFR